MTEKHMHPPSPPKHTKYIYFPYFSPSPSSFWLCRRTIKQQSPSLTREGVLVKVLLISNIKERTSDCSIVTLTVNWQMIIYVAALKSTKDDFKPCSKEKE